MYNLCNNEVTRGLSAVQNRRFITVPFSATTLAVRVGSLALNLAEAVKALVNGEPLSSTSFTEASFADVDAVEAIGTSGAIVYTRLPIVNNVDLETFCPGGKSNIFITSDSDAEPPLVAEPVVEEEEEEDSHDSHDHGETEEEHDHEAEMMEEDDSSAFRFSAMGALAIAAATIAALVY